jgi:hypothetical protein
VGMNNYAMSPTPVLRTLFLDGHAECRTCRAHVRPSKASVASARTSSARIESAWCSVCCTRTDYELQPRRMA